MPLKRGKSQATISANIRELHGGKTFAHTAAKFGKKRANAQAVAIAMTEAGMARPKDGDRGSKNPKKHGSPVLRGARY